MWAGADVSGRQEKRQVVAKLGCVVLMENLQPCEMEAPSINAQSDTEY